MALRFATKSVYAIIVAAGSGNRCPGPQAKQFTELNGQALYLWSVKAFQDTAIVSGIIIVGPGNDEKTLMKMRAETKSLTKVLAVIAGGSSRTESVNNGVTALQSINAIAENDTILVHDGVRPLISCDLIERVAEKVTINQAAIPTVPPTATVKKIVGNLITHTIDRSMTGLAQTPQGVSCFWLRAALNHWFDNPEAAITDEGSLIENLPEKERAQIKMVNITGDPDNLKITFPNDLQRAEILLEERNKSQNSATTPAPPYKPRTATGFGYDVHAFISERKLILGGIEIPHHLGLEGHSDADVLIHALVDAILGAIGAGDIGHHFPDNDPAHKNRCSLDFLEQAIKLVRQQGFYLEAVDITVVAEKPKLKLHIPKMLIKIKETISKPCQVNIKATTTEGLGFTGRREGIAAYAIATVSST